MFLSPEDVPSISGIYALCCPDTKEVKYVGQSKNIRARIKSHIRGDGTKSPKTEWIKGLSSAGSSPLVKILEETSDLNVAEKRHIKREGIENLLNVHHGGEYEGRVDPVMWRVIGFAHPTKMLYLRCKNVGVSREVLSLIRSRVESCGSEIERLALEVQVARILMQTDLMEKAQKWLKVVMPRIESKYPEILSDG